VDSTESSATEAARSLLGGIIAEVCGACEANCCHQGTMVGSHDIPRVVKAALLRPAFAEQVRAGLKQRAVRLRADLAALERVARLLNARYADNAAGALAASHPLDRLAQVLQDWEGFIRFIEEEFQPDAAGLTRCLQFSAIRFTTLRILRELPQAEDALLTIAGPETSFRRGRRGARPDVCLFLVGECLLGGAKPSKCADFYCRDNPGLVRAVTERMTLDQFTLAHVQQTSGEGALRALEHELALGARYHQPKVIFGASPELRAELLRLALASAPAEQRAALREPAPLPQFFASAGEVERQLVQTASGRIVVHDCVAVDPAGIYELCVGVGRARAKNPELPPTLIFADVLRVPALAPHPLWADRAMAQPLSAVDLWRIT